MKLDGDWKACEVDEEINKLGTDSTYDDSSWQSVTVPCTWTDYKDFQNSEGPIIFRKHFEYKTPPRKQRSWLILENVVSQSEVWLDGQFIGETNSYFTKNEFEISKQLALQENHLIGIEVSCPRDKQDSPKRSFTGSFQSGFLEPQYFPGGIQAPVKIKTTGNTAIKHSRVTCITANESQAELLFRLVVDCKESEEIEIETLISAKSSKHEIHDKEVRMLASGENRIEWKLLINEPDLWWPASIGDQPLYDITCSIIGAEGASDTQHFTTGLRTIRSNNLIFSINEKNIFIKSIALAPKENFFSQEAASFEEDIKKARDLGFDMVRVYGHITNQALYKVADELGMLIWQDLPMIGPYTTRSRKNIKAIARATIDKFCHHPSIIVWSCHVEPNGEIIRESKENSTGQAKARDYLQKLRSVLPSWNRSILDPAIKREIEAADPSRPVIASSGVFPNLISSESSDTSLWIGWRVGRYLDLPKFAKRWPRLFEFPGGVGSQSASKKSSDIGSSNLKLDELESVNIHIPKEKFMDATSWANESQQYQSDLLKFHIEFYRKLMFKPCGGFCIYTLEDNNSFGGFGLLDSDGYEKKAASTVLLTNQPVLPVLESPSELTVNQEISLSIHVINDLQTPVNEATLTATVENTDLDIVTSWRGSFDANSTSYVSQLKFLTPPTSGRLKVTLKLETDDFEIDNDYIFEINN